MFTNQMPRNYPVILCLFLLCLHFICGYPGGMSSDSWDQYLQSLNGNYISHHPPLMAMVWSLLHFICEGPETLLLLNLAFFWGGVLLLFSSDSTNKYRYLYFLIPFFPSILSQSTVIWKDVAFTFSSFFVVASCIFYRAQHKAPSIVGVIGLLLIVFYAEGVKFQAKFITPILVLFILSTYLKTSLAVKIVGTAAISIVIIYGNMLLIKHYSKDTHSEQLRQLFDIAGVSSAINNDNLIPAYIKDDKNVYSFEKLKKHYTPYSVDVFIFCDDSKIYNSTTDPLKLQQLQLAYLRAVTTYPLAYLNHRLQNFTMLMAVTRHRSSQVLIANKEEAKKYGVFVGENPFKNIMYKYLTIFPTLLVKNFISLILIFVYFATILIYRKQNHLKIVILSYIVTISLVFTVILFFTTMAPDYRYYYLVRMLSLFSLPIYLNLRYKGSHGGG